MQEAIQSSEATVVAWLAEIDCTTQTKARERPIPGVRNPPKPLRDVLHLDGLPELEGEQLRRVQVTNIAADWFFELLDRCDTMFGAAGVAAKQGWFSWHYKACCWCGARERARPS